MADSLPYGSEVTDTLKHHGIKGMRWGVITKKASIGRKAVAGQLGKANGTLKAYRTKRAEIKSAKPGRTKGGKKSYRKFSDVELQKRIKRLEQEQRYRELKADRHVVRGRQVTRQILEASITKAGTYAATKMMKAAFDKSIDAKYGKGTSDKVSEAVKKAKEGYEAVQVIANEATVKKAARDVRAETRAAQAKAKGKEYKPKEKAKPEITTRNEGNVKLIEKKKSYKQTKPTQKPKRRPRNPGSPLK